MPNKENSPKMLANSYPRKNYLQFGCSALTAVQCLDTVGYATANSWHFICSVSYKFVSMANLPFLIHH